MSALFGIWTVPRGKVWPPMLILTPSGRSRFRTVIDVPEHKCREIADTRTSNVWRLHTGRRLKSHPVGIEKGQL